MPTITTKDGTEIHYEDWDSGRPVVPSHGWPLGADAWEDQMLFLAARGFRCVAHDRRGHGRSSQPGAKVSQGLRDSFWLQEMTAGMKGVYDCIEACSETDFTEDPKRIDPPTLILHGDDDRIVPIGASAMLSAKLMKGSTPKVHPGLPYGLCSTHKDQVNADLLDFLKG